MKQRGNKRMEYGNMKKNIYERWENIDYCRRMKTVLLLVFCYAFWKVYAVVFNRCQGPLRKLPSSSYNWDKVLYYSSIWKDKKNVKILKFQSIQSIHYSTIFRWQIRVKFREKQNDQKKKDSRLQVFLQQQQNITWKTWMT